jgi:antitoxin PrlF
VTIARSKLTAQGQISVPAEVRRRLGVEPGSVLEWDQEGEKIIVRRSARYTSADIHRAVFAKDEPKRRTLDELKAGIRRQIRERHAGR